MSLGDVDSHRRRAGGVHCAGGQPWTTTDAHGDDLGGETGSVESSSTSGSATVEIELQINKLRMNVPVGGSIVLYLEDDFEEPDSISASDVYFVSRPQSS